jgi:hypothetical protein
VKEALAPGVVSAFLMHCHFQASDVLPLANASGHAQVPQVETRNS